MTEWLSQPMYIIFHFTTKISFLRIFQFYLVLISIFIIHFQQQYKVALLYRKCLICFKIKIWAYFISIFHSKMSYLECQSKNRGLAQPKFCCKRKNIFPFFEMSSAFNTSSQTTKNLNKVILGPEKSFLKYQTSLQSLTLPVRCCQQVLEITSLHHLADAD